MKHVNKQGTVQLEMVSEMSFSNRFDYDFYMIRVKISEQAKMCGKGRADLTPKSGEQKRRNAPVLWMCLNAVWLSECWRMMQRCWCQSWRLPWPRTSVGVSWVNRYRDIYTVPSVSTQCLGYLHSAPCIYTVPRISTQPPSGLTNFVMVFTKFWWSASTGWLELHRGE